MDAYKKGSVTSRIYSLTMTTAKSGRRVYCKVTDQYGNSVKSSSAVLKID